MAKKSASHKSDPATLAFSAVENALKNSVLSEGDDNTQKETSEARQNAAKKIAQKSSSIANDAVPNSISADRNDPSKFLYKLQTKSSSTPLFLAAIISLLWFGATGFIAWLQYGDKLTNFIKLIPFMKTMEFASILAVAILPILGFFAIAILIRRASDLRIAANSMTEVATRLAQPETYAVDKIATVGQAVRREVNALGDGLERALTRASELEVMVHNEVTSLENTYSDNDTRLRSLIKELASQRDGIITNSDRVRDAIAQAHTLMIEDIDNAGSILCETIVTQSKEAQQALEQATDTLETSFSDKSENFTSLIDGKTTDLLSVIDFSSENLSLSLDKKLNALNENLKTGTVSISQTIDHKSDELRATFDRASSVVIAQFEVSAQSANGALEAVGTRIVNDIKNKTESNEQAIDRIAKRLDETLSIKFNTMDSRLNTSIIQIGGSIDEASDKASKILDGAGEKTLLGINSRIDEVGLILSTRMNEIDDIIGGKGEKIIISLDEHTNSFNKNTNILTHALKEKASLFNETINSRTKELSDSIENRTIKLNDILDLRTKEFESSIEHKTNELNQSISTQNKDFFEAMAEQTDQIASTIEVQATKVRANTNNAVRSISETMAMRTQDMTKAVANNILDINGNIGKEIDSTIARLEGTQESLNTSIDQAASAIEDSSAKTTLIIEERINATRQSIVEMVDDRLGTLPEAITTRASITADRLTALNEDINSSISKSMKDLEESADRIEEKIGTSIVDASLTISNDVEQTAARMDITVRTALEQVKEAARHIEDLVEVRAVETAQSLEAKVEEMNEALSSQTNNFAQIISEKSEELNNSLKNHSNILRDALGESSSEAEEIMSASTSRILSDVNDALKKLNDGNLLLQRVLETSSTNLFELETSVANQTSNYANAVRQAVGETKSAGEMVGQHVGAMQTTIQSVTSKFSEMLNELSAQTTNINEASSNLDETGKTTIDNLKDRQKAMNELATSFTLRADEIDERMHSFAQNIATTVNETEERLSIAKKAMEETINASTISVASRLDKFADTADQQGQIANEKLKRTQEILVSEMNAALQDATDRFSETASAMRNTAHQVNDELEATRTQLQRGISDLPEETRSSAAAMRRVVAEQIEALSELNSIVRNQRKSNDISSTNHALVNNSVQQNTPVVSPAPVASPVHVASPASRVTQQTPQKTSIENIASITQRIPVAQNEAISNSSLAELLRAPAKKETAIPSATSNTDNKNSWLRDVLRNASAKQEESIKPEISIKNLTTKISQSIDEKALKEAWESYRSGGVNVFSRRIYTLSGQETFEQLRRKMNDDSNFAKNSAAYIEEFEQLLSNAISNPNSKTSTIDLLTSERGKIFTMLAHASERLS